MKYEININNQVEIFELNKVAKQAAGAVLMRIKNAVVLATVAREDTKVEGDFLPLTVQYVEKQYAAGRIPGGYIKRETKPGDFETLTSRIIDRSLRPLFPKGYAYPKGIEVEDINGEVAVSGAAAYVFTVSADGFTMMNYGSKKYILQTGTHVSFNLADAPSAGSYWDVTKNEDGTISIDQTMCNGCGLCKGICKFDAIQDVEV